MKLIIILFAVLINISSAQQKDPYQFLNSVCDRFNEIKDYTVDATITVDVNFLKVPESHAKIFFKQPDKVKMDSEGFALLPKQGLNFSPSKLLDNDFTAIYVKSETLNDYPVEIVKVIPNNDSSKVILSTLYVDTKNEIIRRIETTTKNTGTIEIDLYYDGTEKLGLPSEVKFSFKVGDIQIPATITEEFNEDGYEKKRGKGPMTGTVTVKYENYSINQGLPDSLFAKKNK